MFKLQAVMASVLIMLFASVSGSIPSSYAQSAARSGLAGEKDARPYDAQIYRLSEIIGAVHYLRELCGADEGQSWRNQMRQLLTAEGTSALRRAKLVDSFNKGYRDYARTYRTCTTPALQAIRRFMRQGADIANALVENNR